MEIKRFRKELSLRKMSFFAQEISQHSKELPKSMNIISIIQLIKFAIEQKLNQCQNSAVDFQLIFRLI